MKRQRSIRMSRTIVVLAGISICASSGCARLYHAIHYNGIARQMKEHPQSYYHAESTGKILAKRCYTPVEFPCHGYEPTCWTRWPEECEKCPIADEKIGGEIIVHESVVPYGQPIPEPTAATPDSESHADPDESDDTLRFEPEAEPELGSEPSPEPEAASTESEIESEPVIDMPMPGDVEFESSRPHQGRMVSSKSNDMHQSGLKNVDELDVVRSDDFSASVVEHLDSLRDGYDQLVAPSPRMAQLVIAEPVVYDTSASDGSERELVTDRELVNNADEALKNELQLKADSSQSLENEAAVSKPSSHKGDKTVTKLTVDAQDETPKVSETDNVVGSTVQVELPVPDVFGLLSSAVQPTVDSVQPTAEKKTEAEKKTTANEIKFVTTQVTEKIDIPKSEGSPSAESEVIENETNLQIVDTSTETDPLFQSVRKAIVDSVAASKSELDVAAVEIAPTIELESTAPSRTEIPSFSIPIKVENKDFKIREPKGAVEIAQTKTEDIPKQVTKATIRFVARQSDSKSRVSETPLRVIPSDGPALRFRR